MNKLNKNNEYITEEIDSKEKEYCTNISLEKGFKYSINSKVIKPLFDLNIELDNGTEGYSSDDVRNDIQKFILEKTEFLKKVKEDNWFALEGILKSENQVSKIFKIGNGLENYEPEFTGILYCFLNDVPIMYFNNEGSYRLIIKKLD